mmetsp:Transcript_29185/g.61591  ORF Transcript_29185/g.61591 Transcript_29185/m.61591 type:complete len:112 (+) Transcript_29185:201-536(+)
MMEKIKTLMIPTSQKNVKNFVRNMKETKERVLASVPVVVPATMWVLILMVILSLIKVLRNQFVCARHCRISDSMFRWMLMSSHHASNRMIHGVIFLVSVTIKNEKYRDNIE